MPSLVAVGSTWRHPGYRGTFKVIRSGRRWVTLKATSPLFDQEIKVSQDRWPLMGNFAWRLDTPTARAKEAEDGRS